MATNQTQNYALSQWELSDSVVMADFNADNQKVDAALTNLNQRIDTAVADAEQRLNAIIDQMRTTIPHVQTGTYVGTGTCGEANPNTLTFDFTPKLVIIYQTFIRWQGNTGTSYTTRLIAVNATGSCPVSKGNIVMTWGERSLTWYNNMDDTDVQGNTKDITYHYVAIG
ncbi:MAG: hypothetical protein E7440_02345 [Ruminococcaceae bacterium]|nr:hypothetical protein [Oscillospiraceae bacterium]